MDGCVPESDAQLCQQQQVACGPLDGITDRCGQPRAVADCGACPTGQTCSASGACECAPEPDAALCGARECGTLEVNRPVRPGAHADCGSCEPGQTCSPDGICECVPLAGPELCAELGACGDLQADDGCGQIVQLACGNPCDPDAEVCDEQANRCVCQPETDEILCGRRGQQQNRSSCGSVTITDRCGTDRQVDCGSCGDQGGECGLDGFCTGCRPETRAQLCDRLGAGCDELSAEDNCGQMRTVDCGGCADDRVCQDNQCACPDPMCPQGAECDSVTNACGNSTDCGSCSGGRMCDTNTNTCFCPPAECGNAQCGEVTNACGDTAMCGTCNQGENCENNQCVCPPAECGGAECGRVTNACNNSTMCGTCDDGANDMCMNNMCVCAPDDANAACGNNECGQVTAPDGCGVMAQYDCGSCTAHPNSTCDTSGSSNQCTCDPSPETTLCSDNGLTCGTKMVADGCGMMIEVSCGTCDAGPNDMCNNDNQCECTPYTDADACMGTECGGVEAFDDGCGETFNADCGGCTGSDICDASSCERRATLGPPWSNPDVDDNFGFAVSITETYLAVGAPGRSSDEGRVVIYRRDAYDRSWGEDQRLTPPNNPSGAEFGAALVLREYADRHVLVVGAPGAASGDGRVHLFEREDSASSWTHRFTIPAPSGAERFGQSLDLEDSYLLVGAPARSFGDSGNGQGNAYVFDFSLGSSAAPSVTDLTPSSVATEDTSLGWDVDLDGDYAFVGAPRYRAASKRGRVYVSEFQGGTWQAHGSSPLEQFSDGGDADNNEFGYAVAQDDGWLAVGQPDYNAPGNSDAGIVDLFEPPGAWNGQALAHGYMIDSDEFYGNAVALLGDVLVVGQAGLEAVGNDNDTTANRSSAYVYRRSGSTWSLNRTLDPGGNQNRHVGTSLDVTEQADGTFLIAVGAPHRNDGNHEVYIIQER